MLWYVRVHDGPRIVHRWGSWSREIHGTASGDFVGHTMLVEGNAGRKCGIPVG